MTKAFIVLSPDTPIAVMAHCDSWRGCPGRRRLNALTGLTRREDGPGDAEIRPGPARVWAATWLTFPLRIRIQVRSPFRSPFRIRRPAGVRFRRFPSMALYPTAKC